MTYLDTFLHGAHGVSIDYTVSMRLQVPPPEGALA